MEPRVTVFLSNRVIGRIPVGQAGSMTRLAESLGRRVILDTARLALHIDSAVDGRSVAIDPAPDDDSFGLACAVAGILAGIGARTVLARGAHERPSAWERRRRIRASAVDLTLHLGYGDPMAAYPVWPPASSARAAALLARAVGCHFPTRTIPGRSWAGWSPAVWLTARDPAAVCRGVILFFRGRAQASSDAAQEVALAGEDPLDPLDLTAPEGDEPVTADLHGIQAPVDRAPVDPPGTAVGPRLGRPAAPPATGETAPATLSDTDWPVRPERMPPPEERGAPVRSGPEPADRPASWAPLPAPGTAPEPPEPAPRSASTAWQRPGAVPAHPSGHVFRPTSTEMAPMVREGGPAPPAARGPDDGEDCGGELAPFR